MSRLDEIQARLDAATPGPWTPDGVYYLLAPTSIDGFAFPDERESHRRAIEQDRELVAAAPEDLAALVAVVKAVQAARRDLSHHHAHYVPGRWDKDGSICEVCVRVGAMDEALAALDTDGGAS